MIEFLSVVWVHIAFLLPIFLIMGWVFAPALLDLPFSVSDFVKRYPTLYKRIIILILVGPMAWIVYSCTITVNIFPTGWIHKIGKSFTNLHDWMKK